MDLDATIFVAGTIAVLLIFIGMVIWGYRTRQFHDTEPVKYKMLEEENQ
jgi:cbb3-type cytochrome oxidase subunit 3